mmetsp:Transcript_17334/g.51191  ORF Transcript_17334/g.51191 Transcript_17334/m.51191 type:complete len:594 (-) Transcript_17334:1832-3613(-)
MKRARPNLFSLNPNSSDDDSGENLMEDLESDYVAIPELDHYDENILDHREYGTIDPKARRAAETEIDARLNNNQTRVADQLDDFGHEDDHGRTTRRRNISSNEFTEATTGPMGSINLETMDMPLREWIAQDRTRREIKHRFRTFLESDEHHKQAIQFMCANNLASFEVSYQSLSSHVPILAIWVADAPRDIIEIFDEVANELVTSAEYFPDYGKIKDEIHVRIRELPIVDTLRDLRQNHLNQLVRVHGVVTRRSVVFPQLKMVHFRCLSCDVNLGPFRQNNTTEVRPDLCPCCQRHGPFKVNQEQTVYGNYQKLAIQETPGSVPPGRVPRHKDVVLLADLIDVARPGEEVDVTGVYVHSSISLHYLFPAIHRVCLRYDAGISGRAGFPIFSTTIEANHVAKRTLATEHGCFQMDSEEKRHALRFARDPKAVNKIAMSLAPSIHGHKHVKSALALALFGGCSKNVDGKHRIRGDVNVMLLGDPGCAKSQLLKYCCSLISRAIYTTGKGASAVGLTAGVHKDPITREWTLEGGALVLADNGLCCIDEFDKMNEQDRTSIHEAMEQQSISVSKAGIVTSLHARCSVVAAANPIGGQ